jgi:predicted HicB family RNase H-like nuclease
MSNRMGRPPKSGNETLSERMIVRITPSERTGYSHAAETAGLDLSEWIRANLNKAASRTLKKRS